MFRKLFLFILLGFIVFSIPANASATDRYKWITSTDKISIYYDTQTVRYNSSYGKTVDVWTLWNFTDDGAKEFVEDGRKSGVFTEDKWDNFSHYLAHDLLNSNNQMKSLGYVVYDKNGNVIYDNTGRQNNWKDVIPGSLNETIYNTFASFLKK